MIIIVVIIGFNNNLYAFRYINFLLDSIFQQYFKIHSNDTRDHDFRIIINYENVKYIYY